MGRVDSRINSENPAFFRNFPNMQSTQEILSFQTPYLAECGIMLWGTISERSGGLSCSDSGEIKVEGGPRHVKVASKN